MSASKFCQSCSMPIDDVELRGTEKDGQTSDDYCKYCYSNGEFTHPGLSLNEMVTNISKRMDREGMPEEIAQAAVARLSSLKRWKSRI